MSARQESNQRQDESLQPDGNDLIKITINRQTDMKDKYTVNATVEVTVLISSLIKTLTPT